MNALTLLPKAETFSLTIEETFSQKRDALISEAATIVAVSDEFSQEMAVDALRGLKSLIQAVEDSRVDVKAPVLTLGKKIDTLAKTAVEKMQSEYNRVNGLLAAFTREQLRKQQEAEQSRQAEIQRLERERLKAQQAVADAEADRMRAVTPMEQRQAAVVMDRAQENLKSAITIAPTVQVPVVIPKADNMTVKKVWKFKVVDAHKVYAFSKLLCTLEVSTRVVNATIASGTREIPGLEIWQETETGVKI